MCDFGTRPEGYFCGNDNNPCTLDTCHNGGCHKAGPLNVTANTLNKPFAEIFNEFEDNYLPQSTFDGDGDVKYHLGFSADVDTSDGARIHLFGIAYKKDVSDMRESPALDILQLLHRRGAELSYTDPYVPSLKEGSVSLESVAEHAVDGIDCAVIATDHKVFDYAAMPGRFPLIVDTRNALKGNAAKNIFRL